MCGGSGFTANPGPPMHFLAQLTLRTLKSRQMASMDSDNS
ncbi:hypothetical protein EV385_1842 [Krasilnikovia cinnamomea]|uniref:Uncharacterized protein n=1 Tax=Krasilnikovia cinnamomea TaxID=349313 RepID=A0A4Q7ZIX7_9ACTN|nr:hypothetical protein EV385_1842 [Krasilnikovia cinnamomea]